MAQFLFITLFVIIPIAGTIALLTAIALIGVLAWELINELLHSSKEEEQ